MEFGQIASPLVLESLFLELEIAIFSIKALDIPIALIGYAALSVLKQTKDFIEFLKQLFIKF